MLTMSNIYSWSLYFFFKIMRTVWCRVAVLLCSHTTQSSLQAGSSQSALWRKKSLSAMWRHGSPLAHTPTQRAVHSVPCQLTAPLCPCATSSGRSLVAALVCHALTSYSDIMLQSSEHLVGAQMVGAVSWHWTALHWQNDDIVPMKNGV